MIATGENDVHQKSQKSYRPESRAKWRSTGGTSGESIGTGLTRHMPPGTPIHATRRRVIEFKNTTRAVGGARTRDRAEQVRIVVCPLLLARNKSCLEFVVPQVRWLAAAVAGLALMFSGCDSSRHGYSEKVSRLLPSDSRLYWLDNNRVFVPGYAPDDKLLNEEGKPTKGLYILDTRNNTYVRHADLGDGAFFCFHQGFITYSTSNKRGVSDSGYRQMEGLFGQEKLLPPGVRFNAEFGSNNNSYTDCPRSDREKRLRPEHMALEQVHIPVGAKFLRPEDGYIYSSRCKKEYCDGYGDTAKEGFDEPAKLYRPDRAEPIDLPILGKEFALGSYIRYVEWVNKYLIVPATRKDTPYDYSNALTGKAPYRVYLMSPNGDVETILIPEGKWLPASNAAWTRGGLYFNGNMGTEQGEGGWLLKPDGKLKRIFELTEPTDAASFVSPDGCKLAVPVSFYGNKPRNPFIRIVDFCSKK